MILGRYLLTDLVNNIKIPKYTIVGGVGPYEECTSPIVNLKNCDFKPQNGKSKKPRDHSYMYKQMKVLNQNIYMVLLKHHIYIWMQNIKIMI